MPIDLPPTSIEYTQPVSESNSKAISYEEVQLLSAMQQNKSSIEMQDEEVRIGKKIDKLSSSGASSYEVFLWSKRVGTLVKCEAQSWWTSKVMFVNAERSPDRFTTDDEGNSFPNMTNIQQYFIDKGKEDGKKIQVTMVSTGPTFVQYGKTKLVGVNYDNGTSVGSETSLDGQLTQWRWIAIVSWGKLQLSHTQEMSQAELDALIAKKVDIMTMSSMKRNGKINSDASLRSHTNGHSIVQFNDWSRGELVLNNCTKEDKQKVVSWLPNITRGLYADADAKTNFLDGIWIQTNTGLQYSHPDRGDLFTNENIKTGEPVKDNMPWIIIYYAVQE